MQANLMRVLSRIRYHSFKQVRLVSWAFYVQLQALKQIVAMEHLRRHGVSTIASWQSLPRQQAFTNVLTKPQASGFADNLAQLAYQVL